MKPSKRTSKKVAADAAKFLNMTDQEAWDFTWPGFPYDLQRDSTISRLWSAHCKRFRAICASAVSQTEPAAKKKGVKR